MSAVFITLGLNADTGHVVIAGFSKSKREASEKALLRAVNDEYPYKQSRSFLLCDWTANEIDGWLRNNGIDGELRVQIIRSVGREIEKMMEPSP